MRAASLEVESVEDPGRHTGNYRVDELSGQCPKEGSEGCVTLEILRGGVEGQEGGHDDDPDRLRHRQDRESENRHHKPLPDVTEHQAVEGIADPAVSGEEKELYHAVVSKGAYRETLTAEATESVIFGN